MNIQQIQVNDELGRKLAVYMFLQKFYAGELNSLSKNAWAEIILLISHDLSFFQHDNIKKGITILSQFSEDDIEELEFEFNRLFVGPSRLEASPYESTYRNTERTLMQNETLAVRRFYEKAGLVIAKMNTEPEDHLALELEFICYLLENDTTSDLYPSFLKEHLLQWGESHCQLIREKTNNSFLVGISYLLEGLLLEEKSTYNL